MVASISFNLPLFCISGDVLLLCGGMGGDFLLIILFYRLKGVLIPRVGHSLIWPTQVCAAEQGMVFKILSLKQGIRFHY